MKVLITGSQGKIGQVVTRSVAEAGHDVRSFDQLASKPVPWEHIPGNILDNVQVRRAVMGCEAIVHLAAIPNDRRGASDTVFTTNVNGTWNVIQAAVEAGVPKVVYFSSLQALGVVGGNRPLEHLPISDTYPIHARPAYGLSKYLGEEMCQSFSEREGLRTLCLRPCFVSSPEDYQRWREFDRTRFRRWMGGDFFAYVDVRDVAGAVLKCLDAGEDLKHGRYLLAADDNTADMPLIELLHEHYPEIPWKGSPPPPGLKGSLIDTSAARRELSWKPQHSWQEASG